MTEQQPSVVLAIDYGLKRIGLAISRVGMAEPLRVLPNDREIIELIRQICRDEGVELLLLGISEGEMAKKTQEFGQSLSSELNVPLQLFDETLSSQTAQEKLAEGEVSLKKRRGPIDHYAAASFLQEWLEIHQTQF